MVDGDRQVSKNPIGTSGNSPAIYGWEQQAQTEWSPVGTTEIFLDLFSRPYGTPLYFPYLIPSAEALGYYQKSLRDFQISFLYRANQIIRHHSINLAQRILALSDNLYHFRWRVRYTQQLQILLCNLSLCENRALYPL